MESSGDIKTTAGKMYEIIGFERNRLKILNDNNRDHFFNLDKNDVSYYGKWFSTINIDRRDKLKKLNGLHHS